MEPAVKLSLKNMTKKYSNGDGVENINFDVYEGELLTMLGPSGCGKSTILRTIGGFIDVNGGDILIDGQSVKDLPPEHRPTSMVFQSYNLWPHMTVHDNLAFGLKLQKSDKKSIDVQVKNGLRLVKMEDFEYKYPDQLSGGQQQRVAIARSILLKPSVLLLDEPFSALDAKIRQEMRHELKNIQSELNITIIFVTHDQEEAMTLSDRIIVMNKGVIEQIGSPKEIYDNPTSRFVASFIGAMNFFQDGAVERATRPEDVVVAKWHKSAANSGIIKSMMLLGHYVEVAIKVEQQTIFATLSRDMADSLSLGEHVSLSYKKERIFQTIGGNK